MGVVGNVPSKKMEKDVFWSVLMYIIILFRLKNVHYLPMHIANTAWWLIARGLGSIILSRKFLKKWNKTLEFGCIF